MASNMGASSANNLLDYFLRTTNSGNQTQAPSLWVGLCTGTPTASATNECSIANNYGRVQIAWSTASGGSATGPTGTATWSSASGSWGTISGYVICGASTGSTGTSQYLAFGTVSPTVAVTTNDTVSMSAAAMTLSFS